MKKVKKMITEFLNNMGDFETIKYKLKRSEISEFHSN